MEYLDKTMDVKIVAISGKDYYCIDVSKRDVKCRAQYRRSSQFFDCKVIFFFVPVALLSADVYSLSDQWYGDGTYFFGITEKYDYLKVGEGSSGGPIRRNTLFTKTHSTDDYHIDWND